MTSCWTHAPPEPAEPPSDARAGERAASSPWSNWPRLGSHKLSLPCLFRLLPVIQNKGLKQQRQPSLPAQPHLQLPPCAPQPSGPVRPRDLPYLRLISGSGLRQKRQEKHSLALPATLLPRPSPPRLSPPRLMLLCVVVLRGLHSGNELPPH